MTSVKNRQAIWIAVALEYCPKEKFPSISKKVWCRGVYPTLSRSLCFPKDQIDIWPSLANKDSRLVLADPARVDSVPFAYLPPARMHFWIEVACLNGATAGLRKYSLN